MKMISVQQVSRIEAIDGPTGPITPQLFETIMAPARENRVRVLDAAALIEHNLETIIQHYFFGNISENDGRIRFQSLILSSDWCTFHVKRRLIMHIVNETNVLKGKTKNEFDSMLRKSISFRNAFVHGVFSSDGQRVKMAYFEGAPRSKILTDDYLLRVEEILNMCFAETYKLTFATGASKLSEHSAPPDPSNELDPRNWPEWPFDAN